MSEEKEGSEDGNADFGGGEGHVSVCEVKKALDEYNLAVWELVIAVTLSRTKSLISPIPLCLWLSLSTRNLGATCVSGTRVRYWIKLRTWMGSFDVEVEFVESQSPLEFDACPRP